MSAILQRAPAESLTPEKLLSLVDDRAAEGAFSVHRDIFRDPRVFELEMRHIFEATWVFLGLAGQAPKPHDFFTTNVGRQPVIVSRDGKGRLGAFLNTCRHRGALVCHTERGNARFHTCQYHGWVYDSAGRNASIKDQKAGCYPPQFDADDHSLLPLARFGEYRGFLFGSLSADVPSLEEHLGETRTFLDLIVDQSEHGIEAVPGSSSYVFKGNWKLQIENGLDLYHLTSTHASFMDLVDKRNSGESGNALQVIDLAALDLPTVVRGSYTFRHGHAMTWGFNPKPHTRPLYSQAGELEKRVGSLRTRWMLGSRNLTLYPNVQFAENASLQMRIIRPLAPDRTEMKIYCLGPVGEPKAARTFRLRQFEDFFNVTGLATPDDNVCYEDCQAGYRARAVNAQQGYARGMTRVQRGPDEYARELGVSPETSVSGPFALSDETVFHAAYREWRRLMQAGIAREKAGGA
jgi:benzoate/toluate 1,2-dioxygenase alpha subunit